MCYIVGTHLLSEPACLALGPAAFFEHGFFLSFSSEIILSGILHNPFPRLFITLVDKVGGSTSQQKHVFFFARFSLEALLRNFNSHFF
jgi:hypothetical protein